MMMTAPPSTADQKRDLHVGGVGLRTGGALAAITQDVESSEAGSELAWRARAALTDATSAVRENPWSAIALVAVVGLAAGYLLGRR